MGGKFLVIYRWVPLGQSKILLSTRKLIVSPTALVKVSKNNKWCLCISLFSWLFFVRTSLSGKSWPGELWKLPLGCLLWVRLGWEQLQQSGAEQALLPLAVTWRLGSPQRISTEGESEVFHRAQKSGRYSWLKELALCRRWWVEWTERFIVE